MARINPHIKSEISSNLDQLKKLHSNIVNDRKHTIYKKEMKFIEARIKRAIMSLEEIQQVIGE